MKQILEELKKLGAKVELLDNGIKIIGDWENKYTAYDEYIVEITGALYSFNTTQDKDFLRELKNLGTLYTSYVTQHKDFLRNLKSLGTLYTPYAIQNKDFLRGLENLGYLDTSDAIQNKDFLKNLKSLGTLYVSNVTQNKDFLRELKNLGKLYTSYVTQHKDFLRELKSLGTLDTYNAIQNKDFLKNLKSLGTLYASYVIQNKDFLRGLENLGYLDTYDAIQNKDFLKNLKSLGALDTAHAIQHKDFLKDASNVFKLPFIYKDGILSEVHSSKQLDNGIIIYITNRVGCSETEYIAVKDNFSAHAKTLKLALIDLRFKMSDRDTLWLKDKTQDDILSFEDSVLAYRLITGACSGGVENFLKTHKEKESYSIKEIGELTRGQYGSEEFIQFFS